MVNITNSKRLSSTHVSGIRKTFSEKGAVEVLVGAMVRRWSRCLGGNWKAKGVGAILLGHGEDLRNC